MYTLSSINKYFLRLFKNKFLNKKVIFAGNIKDKIPIYLNTFISFINTYNYNYYIWLKKNINKNYLCYGLMDKKYKNYNFNILIFFWLKNKQESLFILNNILSLFPLNREIFIIGSNNCGIKKINNIKELEILNLKKIINARKHIIFHGVLTKNIYFNMNNYWNYYYYDNYKIYSLPGVFGGKKIDNGSKFLISTIIDSNIFIKGKILDLGCGSGVISIAIQNNFKTKYSIHAIDIDAKAIYSTIKTFNKNLIKNVNVFPSNIYSNIQGKFDLILSNPPIHKNLSFSLDFIYQMINEFKKNINYKGELLFVTNNFISYKKFFNNFSLKIDILSKNKKFSVYRIKNT
ncbi:methyltransferase [Enterobacteriaceae endosymbiont of Donacia bicoloricornis]|uniref:methyltransferase n=1 Tax=Enterobacteriaceae endosymbiont of Donacia bicoloricornis TaxID=2675772 RepID=UPI001448ABF9|nr:methyltransferase [Enterobacteriaceae endosymbiont of Donacia bicoloricornis]QJC37691.1 methyltransferase [Enterobacteriaceae endosymbiont of Donacia bicoloricornis]